MTFTAKIVLGSHTWNLWREQRLKGGVLEGVWFQWFPDESRHGGDYLSNELSETQTICMRDNPDAMLVVTGMYVTALLPVHAPELTPESPREVVVPPPLAVKAPEVTAPEVTAPEVTAPEVTAPEVPTQMPRFASRPAVKK